MLSPTRWIVIAAVLLTATLSVSGQDRIEVTCESAGALERALNRAKNLEAVEIFLHGVCVGNYVIESDHVTLRGATPDSGLAAPGGDPGSLPVLEVIDVKASLRGFSIAGGLVGVWVHGTNSDLLLVDVNVHDQGAVGAYADDGGSLRLIDTTIRDGDIGVLIQSESSANFQRITVAHHRVGVIVADRSTAALNDTTIESCEQTGLGVQRRSDTNVLGGVFRDNGEVYLSAVDRSTITLIAETTIGSESDATSFAMGATRFSRISSFGTSTIYGDVSALDNASIRLGNTVHHGDLVGSLFADAHVRDAEITGSVFCTDGGNVICSRTTTSGAVGCASSTCGSPTAEAIVRSPGATRAPILNESRFERPIRPATSR